MTPGAGPIRVDSVLQQVLEKHGVLDRVERTQALEIWPEVVGEQVAKVTGVKGLDEDTLFVEVRSSAWLMELNMMKSEFLGRVNERLVDAPIRRIVFVLAETA